MLPFVTLLWIMSINMPTFSLYVTGFCSISGSLVKVFKTRVLLMNTLPILLMFSHSVSLCMIQGCCWPFWRSAEPSLRSARLTSLWAREQLLLVTKTSSSALRCSLLLLLCAMPLLTRSTWIKDWTRMVWEVCVCVCVQAVRGWCTSVGF